MVVKELFLITVIVWIQLSSAQFLQPFLAVPPNCGRFCFPPDGYAVFNGQTQCFCRSDLCRNFRCSRRQKCGIQNVRNTDVPRCELNRETTSFLPRLPTNVDPNLSPADRCSQPPVTGVCRALFPRFYFDPVQFVCKQFTYGGCGGNSNNFETLADCLQACQPGNIGNSNRIRRPGSAGQFGRLPRFRFRPFW